MSWDLKEGWREVGGDRSTKGLGETGRNGGEGRDTKARGPVLERWGEGLQSPGGTTTTRAK